MRSQLSAVLILMLALPMVPVAAQAQSIDFRIGNDDFNVDINTRDGNDYGRGSRHRGNRGHQEESRRVLIRRRFQIPRYETIYNRRSGEEMKIYQDTTTVYLWVPTRAVYLRRADSWAVRDGDNYILLRDLDRDSYMFVDDRR